MSSGYCQNCGDYTDYDLCYKCYKEEEEYEEYDTCFICGNKCKAEYDICYKCYEEEGFESKINYKKYLLSEKWKAIRRKILLRDNYACQDCSDSFIHFTPAKQVHHITYKNLGNENPEDLISLCEDCHKKRHQKNEY